MMAKVVFLFLYAVLAIGQGRQVMKGIRTEEAGWGQTKFAKSSNPKGYLAMTLLNAALFLLACVAATIVAGSLVA